MTDQRPDPFQPPSPEPFAPPAAGTFEIAPPTTTPVRMSSGGSRALTLALGLAIVVGASGIAFAAGRATAPATAAAGNPGTGPTASQGVPGGQGNNGPVDLLPGASGAPGGQPGGDDNGGFRPGDGGFPGFDAGPGGFSLQGTVESVTPTSVTLKLPTGQTVTFTLDASTAYTQQVAGSASDVQAGRTVIVSLSGRFRPDDLGGSGGTITLGTAGAVTVVP